MKKSNGPKCIECGKTLPMWRGEVEAVPGFPEHREGRGFRADRLFCAMQCGYTFAARWMKRILFWRRK